MDTLFLSANLEDVETFGMCFPNEVVDKGHKKGGVICEVSSMFQALDSVHFEHESTQVILL